MQVKFFTKVKLQEIPSSISCFNIFGTDIITGDEKGVITTYQTSKNKLTKVKETSLKSKIEKIFVPLHLKIALVLAGGEVYLINLPSMSSVKNLLKSKDVIDMYTNKEDSKFMNNFLVITKKKKIKIYEFEYSQNNVNYFESKIKDASVDEFPVCATWTTHNTFIYSSKSKVIWHNLDKGTKNSIDFADCVQLLTLGGKTTVASKDMALFMDNGTTCQFNPILNEDKDFIAYSEFKNHIIALYKNSIIVYKAGEQNYDKVERVQFNEGEGKLIATSNYKVIVCTENANKTCVLDFRERPLEDQIKSLIEQKMFDNCLEKVIESTTEDDEEKPKKLEKLYLDCAWASIKDKKKDYDTSIKYLSLTNFNPFEFIYMYYDLINVKIIHDDKKDGILEQKKVNQILTVNSKEDEEQKAYSFLIQLLTKKRDYLLNKYNTDSAEYEKEKVEFMSSEWSIINLSTSTVDITVRTALDFINLALIKSMIKSHSNPQDIESVLDNKSIDYSIFNDFESDKFFLDDTTKELNETKFTLAYINEKRGDYESALKEWRNFGMNDDEKNKKYSLIAKDRTKNIFYKFKESKGSNREEKEKFFKEYIQWLLKKYPYEAFEVATKTEIVSNKIFLEDIIQDFEKDNNVESGSLKRQFLEYCNDNLPNEVNQTLLLKLYADKMLSLSPKDPGELKDELKDLHDAFMKIIKNPSSCYNKRAIIEYIEKIEWLKEPRKDLYSQLKEYDKALDELFKDAKFNLSFDKIKQFCEENLKDKPDIFEIYYKYLSDYVLNDCQKNIDKDRKTIKQLQEKIKSSKQLIQEKENDEAELKKLEDGIKRLEDLKKPYEKEMLNVLKKYGKINNINPLFALENANENWNIFESNDFFNYLSNVVKEFTVEVNKYKIGKNLSDIGLVYKEKEAYEYKKKYVTIDSDKQCDLCKKKIGNTIFVVYPNMKVYHSKCALNHNIDPMTGVDFSKKKYIE